MEMFDLKGFEMGRCTESPSIPLHIKLLYFVSPIAGVLLAFLIQFNGLAQSFEDELDTAVYQIETKVNSFEVALEGFANFIAISHDIQDDQIRAYAQGIRRLYPDLYMFEIASKVPYSDRDAFERLMRIKGYPDFRIHGFDYTDTRQVTTVAEKQFYYPIRFIEPESSGVREVLGLDLASSSGILIETLVGSLTAPRPLASRPFELLEGGKGYVIYRPAVTIANDRLDDADMPLLNFAMLVIRGKDLLPNGLMDQSGYRATLSFTGVNTEDVAEVLVEPIKTEESAYPRYTYTKTVQVENESQPFRLTLEKDISWNAFNWLQIIGITLASVLFFYYLTSRLSKAHSRDILAKYERDKLYSQANFDLLTGLPNTNLLMDRAEQAIRMAERSGSTVAICYLDLDKFKVVNDTWGHDAGNELLIQIALRLKQALRAEDTVARIHGDEFVILLPEVNKLSAWDYNIPDKLLSIFEQPFDVAGQALHITGSFGVASYPEDGRDLESLLGVSDKRMYVHKHELNALMS